MNEHEISLWQFMQEQSSKIWEQLLAHIGLTFVSLFIAIIIAVPLGIFIARKKKFAGIVLGVTGVLQTIPSIALLGFMIPVLGIGPKPAIVALFLYALLPILRNTFAGITGVDAAVRDAANGMGLSRMQVLLKVELPLAFPVIMAGIRTATVINVGVATLAAYIAAGGLGEFIFGGIALNNMNMILAGAIPAALLAILLDFLLGMLQKMKRRKLRVAFILLPFICLVFSSFYLLPGFYGTSLLAGFTPEFMGRQDGYLGLKKVYDLNIRNVVISDAVMYKAAYEKKLDVISGYSTDGRLKSFGLVALEDDKKIFPPYYVAPVVRNEVLEKHPELETILNMLAGKISDSTMTALNYDVDFLKISPEDVARKFLQQQQLYKPPQNGDGDEIRIGSKIFGEQYTLAAMYSMLIEGHSNMKATARTGLGGTTICIDALINDQIDMYPEYSGTALLVILKANEDIVRKLAGNKDSVHQYVQQEFQKKYKLSWLKPVGFNNTYALMMRKAHARQLGIITISDLVAALKN